MTRTRLQHTEAKGEAAASDQTDAPLPVCIGVASGRTGSLDGMAFLSNAQRLEQAPGQPGWILLAMEEAT